MKCVCKETHALKFTLHRLRAALLDIASDILVKKDFTQNCQCMNITLYVALSTSLSGKRAFNHLKHQGNYLKHKINVNLSAIRSLSNTIMYCSSNCYIVCKPMQIMLHKQTYTNGLLNSNSTRDIKQLNR